MVSKAHGIKKEIIKNLIILITAAFAFVAAFAWNDAAKTIFLIYYGEVGGIVERLLYALIVTIIAVFAAMFLGRIKGRMGIE